MPEFDADDQIDEVEESAEEVEQDGLDEVEPESEDDLETDFDMDDVPEFMREKMEAYKKSVIQGMNKKFQKSADERKTLEQRAKILDDLENDPKKRKAFAAYLGAMDGDEAGAAPQGTNKMFKWDEESYEQLDESYREPIRAAMAKFIESEFMPVLKPYMGAIEQMYQTAQGSEWKQLESEIPGADQHRKAAEELARKTGLTKKQALAAVMADEVLQAKVAPHKAKPKPKPITKSLTKHNVVPASRSALNGKGDDPVEKVARLRRAMGFEF